MKRLATTVLTVVGPGAGDCVRSFSRATNVATVEADGDTDDARARNAWGRVTRSRRRYTLHDADPLRPIGEAWVASFEQGARGRLEVLTTEAVRQWRADSIGLPDYYLVLEPDDLPDGLKDWYLGVLHRASPNRVVPVAAEHASVADAIGRLVAGRWWPDLDVLLADLPRRLPDQLMTADDENGAADEPTSNQLL